MTIKQRLKKIEERLEQWAGDRHRPTLVVVYDSSMPIGPQSQAAIAEYKARNPEYQIKDPKGFDVIYVVSETAKQLTERALRGERTEQLCLK